jgi:2-polyprenyl-3-methyl-5-hydroxy-6-metoxy-1,4-benzoquinol methylase
MSAIEEYYNQQYDEWGRLERHRIEFEMTKKALDEYIEADSEVLDVGGGPGRYSIYLAQRGHKVTLFDLSEMLVKQAVENAANAGVALQDAVKGNALELDKMLPGKSFDAVLCMGPLYHLLEKEERREAVRQCLARLRPGGILIAAFISAYAPAIDGLKGAPNEIGKQKSWFLKLLDDGRHHGEFGFTDAYFIDPEKVEAQFDGFDLETLRIMGTESLGALREDSMKLLEESVFQEWIDLFYRIADRKAVLGACEHLLYIGKKTIGNEIWAVRDR